MNQEMVSRDRVRISSWKADNESSHIGHQQPLSAIFPRRKTSIQNEWKDHSPVVLTPSILVALSNMPLCNAAQAVGVSSTAFKKACRKLGVARWNYKRGASKRNQEEPIGQIPGADVSSSDDCHVTAVSEQSYFSHASTAQRQATTLPSRTTASPIVDPTAPWSAAGGSPCAGNALWSADASGGNAAAAWPVPAADLLDPRACGSWESAALGSAALGVDSGDSDSFLTPAEAEGWEAFASACIAPGGPVGLECAGADFFCELDGEPAAVPAGEAGGGGMGGADWGVAEEALLSFGDPAPHTGAFLASGAAQRGGDTPAAAAAAEGGAAPAAFNQP